MYLCPGASPQPEVWIAEKLRLPHLVRDGGPIMASSLPMHTRTEYKGCGAMIRAPQANSPPIVIPIAPSVPSCSKSASRWWARDARGTGYCSWQWRCSASTRCPSTCAGPRAWRTSVFKRGHAGAGFARLDCGKPYRGPAQFACSHPLRQANRHGITLPRINLSTGHCVLIQAAHI